MRNSAVSKSTIAFRPNAPFSWLKLNLPYVALLALVFAATGIVYGNDLTILANEAIQNEAFSHVLIFPFLAGFLFYLKRDIIKASLLLKNHHRRSAIDYIDDILGAIFVFAALLIYWYGSFTFYPLEYHIASLPVFITGIVLIVLDSRALGMLIFPILFIFFLVPIPTTALYAAGGTLANFNTQISYNVLKTAGMPLTLSSTYGAPTIQLMDATGQPMDFSVDVPCSGIYSLIAFTMFAAFLAFVSRTSVLKKIWLFVLGFFVFWILNLARIMGILTVAHWFGPDTAMFIHSFAGLVLVFIGMILILVISDKILKVKIATRPPAQAPCSQCQSNGSQTRQFCENCGRYLNKRRAKIPMAAFLKLIVLVLGSSIAVLAISAPTFITSASSLELTSSTSTQPASNVFPELEGYRLAFLYRDVAYEKISRQDASLMYGYLSTNVSQPTIYADIGVSNSMSNLHNWEVCYVSYQTAQGQSPLVDVLDSQDTQLLPDTSLVAKYFIFESPQNYTQATLYWFGKATFKTGASIEQKYYRISLIIITRNQTAIPQYKQELFTAGQAVATSLEPLKTQALLSLGVPMIQYLLIGAAAFLAFTKTTQLLAKQRTREDNLKIFNSFASKKERIILKVVDELAATKKYMKTMEINENVEKTVGKPVNHKRVQSILKTLEKNGLISKTVISKENVPEMVWKAQV